MLSGKKSPRADLNRFSGLFLLLGLVLVLFASWRIVEFKQYGKDNFDDEKWVVNAEDLEQNKEVKIEQPKIEQQQQKKAPPAEVRKVIDEDDIEDIEFESSETDEDEAIDEPQEIQTVEPEEEVDVPFKFVESAPVFPGCEKYEGNKKKLKACMSRKIERFINRYFDKGIGEDIGISGIAYVKMQFIVDKNGNIVDIRARSPYKELEKEAMRVLKKLPKMQPGKQRGKPVRVRYNMDIKFRVDY